MELREKAVHSFVQYLQNSCCVLVWDSCMQLIATAPRNNSPDNTCMQSSPSILWLSESIYMLYKWQQLSVTGHKWMLYVITYNISRRIFTDSLLVYLFHVVKRTFWKSWVQCTGIGGILWVSIANNYNIPDHMLRTFFISGSQACWLQVADEEEIKDTGFFYTTIAKAFREERQRGGVH